MFRFEIKYNVCDEKPFYILKEKKLVFKAFQHLKSTYMCVYVCVVLSIHLFIFNVPYYLILDFSVTILSK